LPLQKKPSGLIDMSEDILELLCKQNDGAIDFDITGSIGKRYKRQDEIGTPLCITIDQESLENNTFTVRYRDTMEQIRIDKNYLIEHGWRGVLKRFG
jgi:glycyl-tRNA synthetase|tara:strand:+ start:378 stop:668 length:291 start_codon:yes stop_codon:yes gene_type:complete